MFDSEYHRIQAIVARRSTGVTFYKEFVETFSQIANVEIGLAWNCEEHPFTPICQVYRDETVKPELPLSSQRHQAMLMEAYRSKKASLFTPPTNGDSPSHSILISPIRKGDSSGLVEFIFADHNDEHKKEHVFRAFADCCRIANGSAKAQELSSPSSSDQLTVAPQTKTDLVASDLDAFTEHVHQSLDARATSTQIANEGRRVLNSDRVTVFRKHGRSFRAEAVSGQPKVNRRSNAVKALTRLSDAVLKTEQPFWFPTDFDVPQQIHQPLDDYVRESMTRSLVVIPLFNQPEPDPCDPRSDAKSRKVIGGLVIEQAHGQWERALVEPVIQSVTKHASIALRNAESVNGIFLYRLWHAIGHTKLVTTARGFSRTLLFLVCVAAIVAAMLFVPANFNLSCDGRMIPSERQRIFADQTGTITKVRVTHRDFVEIGDTLLELKNEELDIQKEQLVGEQRALQERLAGDRSMRISGQRRSGQRDEIQVSQAELQAQISSLERRVSTINSKVNRLKIKSNLTGQVLTWDIQNLLQDRPVQQGDYLLEIANTSGQWELELNLPDRKVGHLIQAIDQNEQPLSVVFTLASEPGKRLTGEVREVAQATSVNADRMHFVRVKVDIDEADIADLKHAGSTVSAKINCGERSLGYVWLHDAWEFIQYRVLFHVL